jgi:CrcB protein
MEPGMNKVLLTCVGVGILGAAGSLMRYGVAEGFKLATSYPAGTLAVNVVGAFALGWVNTAFKDVPGWEVWRIALGVGLLGGFTTFSSMMWDSDKMLTDAQYLKTAAYLGLSVFLGLLAVRAGALVGKGM